MKHLICLLLLFCYSLSFAQEAERSTVTDIINNKKVYVHTVKPGETVFGLCKLYNCTQDDIKTLNTGSLINGLSAQQKLYLPYSEQTKARTFSNNTLSHTVEKGETMYGISKKYNISISELLAKKPFLTDGIKPGQVLTIPTIQNESQTKPTVAVSTTQPQNSAVKKEALFPPAGSIAEKPIEKPIEKTTVENNCDSLVLGKSSTIVLIVPFYLKQNDSIQSDIAYSQIGGTPSYKSQDNIYSKSLPYLEFYEGALLALDSLKSLGFQINLLVYDSKRDGNGIDGILKELESKNINLIIGSNDQSEFEKIAAFAKRKGIAAVSPLSTNIQLLSNNKSVILANTPHKCRLQAEAIYSLSLKRKNYVFVHAGHVNEIENIEQIKKHMLPSYKNDTSYMNKFVKVVRFSTYSMAKFEKAMDTGMNVVIIPSEDQAFVNDVLTKINIYKRKYNIELHGLSVWENYKNLELDYLFDLRFKAAVSSFRDYTNNNVKSFISKFRSVYNNEPSKISFLGFDIFMYFGKQSALYGKQLIGCGLREKYNGLQNSFTFKPISTESGIFNSYVAIIEYTSDYQRIIHPINIKIKQANFEPSEKRIPKERMQEEDAD